MSKSPSKAQVNVRKHLSSSILRTDQPHLMICAEALFAGDPKNAGDLSYKLALRMAYYLEPNNERRRQEVFSQVRDAYSARSNIVHGNRRQPGVQRSIDKAIVSLATTEDLLRSALGLHVGWVVENPGKKFDFDRAILAD